MPEKYWSWFFQNTPTGVDMPQLNDTEPSLSLLNLEQSESPLGTPLTLQLLSLDSQTRGTSTTASIKLPTSPADTGAARSVSTQTRSQFANPDGPQQQYQINQKCIYEHMLPGNAYVSAHLQRVQHGIYRDLQKLHADPDINVVFVALDFVLHPSDSQRHRFKSAVIDITVSWSEPSLQMSKEPKIIKFAPHLVYGSSSPESLKWIFNLAGSVGISQALANATLSPSGGFEKDVTLHSMMKIQGSTRTNEAGVEDGKLVWSLEENASQKSGLPREFTFALLIHHPDTNRAIDLNIDVRPAIARKAFGYPDAYVKKYQAKKFKQGPFTINGSESLGQTFGSGSGSGSGIAPFNFAMMQGGFEDMVELPGTTYSTNEPDFSDGGLRGAKVG
ncbi:hypothetical protein MMC06_004954 [Schaereria dolodes]|nr:hypothetical protein [Schaereria dolodes]